MLLRGATGRLSQSPLKGSNCGDAHDSWNLRSPPLDYATLIVHIYFDRHAKIRAEKMHVCRKEFGLFVDQLQLIAVQNLPGQWPVGDESFEPQEETVQPPLKLVPNVRLDSA